MTKDSPVPSPSSADTPSGDTKNDSKLKTKRGRKPSQAKLAMLESKKLFAEKRKSDATDGNGELARKVKKKVDHGDAKKDSTGGDSQEKLTKKKKTLVKTKKPLLQAAAKKAKFSRKAITKPKTSAQSVKETIHSRKHRRKKPVSRYGQDGSDDDSSSGEELWEDQKSTPTTFRSDHCYEDRDDLFFDSEDDLNEEFLQNSDEDTEDASETDMATLEEEISEMKEKMYQEKISELKDKIEQLKAGTLPEYVTRHELLLKEKEDWIEKAEAYKAYMMLEIDKEHKREKELAWEDFELKKEDLRESLIAELNEKKKVVETEKMTLELTGGVNSSLPLEVKPVVTRKLRRRPNDPPPVTEKKRKATQAQLREEQLLLDEDDILADLKKINKYYKPPSEKVPAKVKAEKEEAEELNGSDAKIKDEKLLYNKDWYTSGDAIHLTSKEGKRFNAQIHSIGSNEIWIKKLSEGTRLKIYLSHLHKGKYSISRREVPSKKKSNSND